MRVRLLALLLLGLPGALVRPAAAGPAGAPGVHGLHEIEAGALIGGRFFSGSNELGRFDLDPRSPQNAPQHTGLVGLGVSYAPHPRIAVEAELGLLPTTTRDGGATVVMLTYRAHALVHLLTGRLRPFLLVGGGATSLVSTTDCNRIGTDTDGLLHGGAGLKLDLPRSLVLRLDGRVLLPPRIEDTLVTPEFEVLFGIGGRFALGRPRPARTPEKVAPAPVPVRAPAPVRPAPSAPEPAKPEPVKPEPAKPEPAKAPVDSDGDGVPDADDRCPDKPETKNGFTDEDGCPDASPRELRRLATLAAAVAFAPGKPLFQRTTLPALKGVAQLLQAFPSVRLEIIVSAAEGPEPAALAERRAALLRLYLTEIGVAEARLSAAAGPPQPRGKRRLVEIRLAPP